MKIDMKKYESFIDTEIKKRKSNEGLIKSFDIEREWLHSRTGLGGVLNSPPHNTQNNYC